MFGAISKLFEAGFPCDWESDHFSFEIVLARVGCCANLQHRRWSRAVVLPCCDNGCCSRRHHSVFFQSSWSHGGVDHWPSIAMRVPRMEIPIIWCLGWRRTIHSHSLPVKRIHWRRHFRLWLLSPLQSGHARLYRLGWRRDDCAAALFDDCASWRWRFVCSAHADNRCRSWRIAHLFPIVCIGSTGGQHCV